MNWSCELCEMSVVRAGGRRRGGGEGGGRGGKWNREKVINPTTLACGKKQLEKG